MKRAGRNGARRLLRAVVALVATALVATGCSPVGSGGARFVFSRFGDSITQPVGVQVSGLRPGEPVVVTATADTSMGVFSSHAVYAVGPDGRVRLWTQEALAGPYPRPDGSGLLWSMTGPSLSQRQLEDLWLFGAPDVRFTAEQDGHLAAGSELRRGPISAGTVERDVLGSDVLATGDPAASGIAETARVGALVVPAPGPIDLRPGVIVIDGDAGGASGAFASRMIAAAGFPALVLPAFGPEGQIAGSAALSVETFDAVLTWFAALPIVDADRVFVYGTGRASSIALWFATHEPARLHGAFAATGATALQCTSSDGNPLLVEHGLAVPCANPERTIADTDILPLDRIPGPLVLACGEDDRQLPTACDWTRAGESARGSKDGDAFLYADAAGHDITTPPLLPIGLSELPPATAQATEDARSAFWALVVAKLAGAMRP